MKNTALITGASSGIGREFARYHAAKGGNLIITARKEAALNDLKAELEMAYGVTVHVIVSDLGAAGSAEELYGKVRAFGVPVDILINNAGFGGHGVHIERDLATEQQMIQLNVQSLVTLTHEIAQDMVAQGGGKILQVGSTAGFMPGPLQAVYYATKAFVNSYSQAIDEELRDYGVTCTVLTPGFVETEFVSTGNLEGVNAVKSDMADPVTVARIGYDAMMAGELVAFNRTSLKIMLTKVLPFIPRRRMLKISRGYMEKE